MPVLKVKKNGIWENVGNNFTDWNAKEGEPGHVLNRTHWIEMGMVEILPETTVALEEEGLGELPLLNLVAGETYVVNWNGAEYSCVAQLPDPSKVTDIAIGNLAMMGQPDTGEPFVMICSQEANATIVLALDGTVSTEVPISIKGMGEIVHKLPGKFLPDGVPYVEEGGLVEILPECQPTFDEEEQWFILASPPVLEIGKTYVINWNGVEYTCVGIDAAAMAEPGAVILGDVYTMSGGVIGNASTGEPFAMTLINNEDSDGNIAQVMVIVPFDSSTELTISIKVLSEKVHKLDEKFLPLDWIPKYKEILIGEEKTVTGELGPDSRWTDLRPALGQKLAVYFDGKRYQVEVKTFGEGVEGYTYAGNYSKFIPEFTNMNTGEPFCLLIQGVGTTCLCDGEHRVSIYGLEPNKIPSEFLPDEKIYTVIVNTVVNSDDQLEVFSVNGSFQKALDKLIDPYSIVQAKVYVYFNIDSSEPYAGVVYYVDGAMVEGSSTYIYFHAVDQNGKITIAKFWDNGTFEFSAATT